MFHRVHVRIIHLSNYSQSIYRHFRGKRTIKVIAMRLIIFTHGFHIQLLWRVQGTIKKNCVVSPTISIDVRAYIFYALPWSSSIPIAGSDISHTFSEMRVRQVLVVHDKYLAFFECKVAEGISWYPWGDFGRNYSPVSNTGVPNSVQTTAVKHDSYVYTTRIMS